MSCNWLTVKEAAMKVGKKKSTIYRWINENRFKSGEVMELVNGQIVVCENGLVRPHRRKRSVPRAGKHINQKLL